MARKSRLIYEESYASPRFDDLGIPVGGVRIKDALMPSLPSVTAPFDPCHAFILKAGKEQIGTEELEFQVLKIYLRARRETRREQK